MKMERCHKPIRYFKEVMKSEVFHHFLSGKEVKDLLPELGFMPRSGSKNAILSIFQQILKDYKKKRRDFSSVSFFSFVSKFEAYSNMQRMILYKFRKL